MSSKVLLVAGLIFLVNCTSAEDACAERLSIDISDGVHINDSYIKDGITYGPGDYFIQHKNAVRGCICKFKHCIIKCCPKGQIFLNKNCQVYNLSLNFDVFNHTIVVPDGMKNLYVLYNNPQSFNNHKRLKPWLKGDDIFFIQVNGQVQLSAPNEVNKKKLGPEEYCVETFKDIFANYHVSILYPDITNDPIGMVLQYIGMIISMPFLLVTFLVYAILPDKNLHGKCLMCYVLTLLVAYILLICIQLAPREIEFNACVALGFLCLLFFMASFFWMNVMCFDIWSTFSEHAGLSTNNKQTELRKFIFYCTYAWGVPLLFIIIIIGIQFSHIPRTKWYHPEIGCERCWFRTELAILLYFYGPMTILIILNTTLFIITTCKIKQAHKDTAVLNKRYGYENDQKRFNLYVKLILAMGINWSTEIISWAVVWRWGRKTPKELWYFTDLCNAMYGVVIFFIFVFKKNIWRQLKRRYYLLTGKSYFSKSKVQMTNLTTAYTTTVKRETTRKTSAF